MLYRKHNYLNKEIKYLKKVKIYEYDIHSAGLNILHHLNIIDDEDYIILSNIEKDKRNYLIGLFLRENSENNDIMMKEFIQIRKDFFIENKIEDEDVLAIKKDAVFLIDKKARNNIIDTDFTFNLKNDYDCYLNIDNTEFYYNLKKDLLDVKGFNKEAKETQKDYFLKTIKYLIRNDFNNMKEKNFEFLINFKDNFLNFKLDKNFYRDLKTNLFTIKIKNNLLGIEHIDDNTLEKLFINYNLNFINNLIKIFC